MSEATEQPAIQVTRPRVSPLRLVLTLGIAGALAGLLLAFVNALTAPLIAANREEALRKAVNEVLHAPARYDTLYLHDGELKTDPPDPKGLEAVYLGYDEQGKRVGFAIARGEPGFQDTVGLIFGYDPVEGRVLGMRVLESKETPGLGDKIEKDPEFVGQFEPDPDAEPERPGPKAPLLGVKSGRGSGADSEIDMITGATISSKAVIRIINNALKKWEPHIKAYLEKGAGG